MKQSFRANLLLFALLGGTLSSLDCVAAKTEATAPRLHLAKKPSPTKLTPVQQEGVVNSVLEAVKESYPDYAEWKDETPPVGVSFFSRLSSQFGFFYAKRRLPALLYQHLSPYLALRVSEEDFYTIWDGSIHLSTGADFERAFAKNLKNKKVPASLASASAKVVATIVSELV